MTADYAARLADDTDPLLRILRAARAWRVAPTVFLGQRKGPIHEHDAAGRVVHSIEWTTTDTELALALEAYEAGLCPGCRQPLDETSRDDYRDAYRPEQPIRCHYCTAQALVEETAGKQHENPAGLLFPIELDPALVDLNRQPVPPLPPELQ